MSKQFRNFFLLCRKEEFVSLPEADGNFFRFPCHWTVGISIRIYKIAPSTVSAFAASTSQIAECDA